MKHSTMVFIAASMLWAVPAAADDAFSYDALRPGAQFQWNTIQPGRDMAPAGSLSGPAHAGKPGPLGDTEGPGVRAAPEGGWTGPESQIDCGPGGRYLDMTTGERLRRLEPLACPGRF